MSGGPATSDTMPADAIETLLGLYQAGHFAQAADQAEALVARFPGTLMLYNIMGAAGINLGEFDKAEAAFRSAIAIDPAPVELHNNLGIALYSQGKFAEAVAVYRHALGLKPDHASAHYNLANALRRQHAIPAAIASYRRALALKPDYVEAHNNLGRAFQQQGQLEEALEAYRAALDIKPDSADALQNIATVLVDVRDYAAAAKAFGLVTVLRPDDHSALVQKLFAQAHLCDFSAFRDFAALQAAGQQLNGAIPPFQTLTFLDDPEQQLGYSRDWAKGAGQSTAAVAGRAKAPQARIRVGYFSADFHEHATLRLMAGLFREHDRQRFEIVAYSYGPANEDSARDRLIRDVDRFEDIAALSDSEVAELVHGDALDIAVDLKGYTERSRFSLFASRLAPVQISHVGYPGSLGADYIDYLVADAVVVPEAMERFYSERIIRLPGSYQPNDSQQAIAPLSASRAELGLPAVGFVFCCFNQSYKITPAEFDIWMRVLQRVEGSVLWLLKPNLAAEANLRQEAASRGVDPDRLVFAEWAPHADNLARLQHADLFIDTFNVNAHTTASDALWAGLPVVTKAGRQFAARVCASLLHAVGLPELVTDSAEAYEALIGELASDPARLAALKAKLARNRLSTPLFDSRQYARNLEQAYAAAHARFRDGLAPARIVVA